MPYVVRDAQHNIIRIEQQSGAGAEPVNPNAPELRAFLAQQQEDAGQHLLSLTDIEMIRVIEDVIYLLIDKNVILYTDLPHAVQQKLKSRREARRQLAEQGPLLVEEDDIL